jgi:ligand-binding SRPBCC domain-containing protein
MKQYQHAFRVNAPLSAVADFHRSTAALRQLSPPPMIVQFHDIEPMGEGSVSDFTLWLGPLPIRWVAVHSDVSDLHGFTDSQRSGPYTSWVHRHTFREIDANTTEVIDEVQAEQGNLLSRFMWFNLPILFAYRGWKTRRVVVGNLE